jgi:acyl-CoA thioester hydrolase
MEFQQLVASHLHKVKIQVRFKDIDKQGHVNNAVHLTYFEIARVDYFNEVLKNRNNWNEISMILAKTEITYTQPILLADAVYCYTKITRLGTKSFDIEHTLTIENENEKRICAHGKSVLVCYNYSSKETIQIPNQWLSLINEYERGQIQKNG